MARGKKELGDSAVTGADKIAPAREGGQGVDASWRRKDLTDL